MHVTMRFRLAMHNSPEIVLSRFAGFAIYSAVSCVWSAFLTVWSALLLMRVHCKQLRYNRQRTVTDTAGEQCHLTHQKLTSSLCPKWKQACRSRRQQLTTTNTIRNRPRARQQK